ncbi:MAG: hypothetical protein IJZ35_09485 [Clostridia bacterium]|nr:hypothetical protein [Clostridia bacterium]
MEYRLTESIITIEEKNYTTYGIAGENVSFDDVSLDKNKTKEMVDRINREQLDECHLMEFITDELNR